MGDSLLEEKSGKNSALSGMGRICILFLYSLEERLNR